MHLSGSLDDNLSESNTIVRLATCLDAFLWHHIFPC